ncbi:MAG TPA: hypothetical protein VFP61_15560 [Acidimicrobiales bacterium]|nr:hypothetical protein [Acidimicrobiales bacterium]
MPGADHVVVTPSAVWVIASIASGGVPSLGELGAVRAGAAEVSQSISASLAGLPAPVRAVVVSSAPQWAAAAYIAGGVNVVGAGSLVRLLHRSAVALTPDEVDDVAEVIDAAFPNRWGASTSVVRPSPAPPASPELPVLHPSGTVCTGAPALVRQPETVIGLMLRSVRPRGRWTIAHRR